MSRTRDGRAVPRKDLRQIVDRLSVERMLSDRTILRMTLDFIQERGDEPGSTLHDEYVRYLKRRTR